MPGLVPRNDNPPCPEADGTTIGSQLQFNLFCGQSVDGDVIDTLDAASLPECVELCANTHPRCNAVTYSDRDNCRMISNMDGNPDRSRFRDAAVANYPTLGPSGCTNGGPQALGGGQFTMSCGKIINGADLSQRHHRTMAECAEDCAVTQGCAAFAYNAGLDLGFMNCYLKNSVPDGSISDFGSVDVGVLNAAVDTSPDPTQDGGGARGGGDPATGGESEEDGADANGGDSGGAANPVVLTQPAQTVTEVLPGTTQVVTLSPDANAETPSEQVPGFNTISASAGPGGILFTPSRAVATRTVVQLSTSASSVISITQLVTVPADIVPTGVAQMGQNGNGGIDTDGDDNSENMAWVAAPVVGGIAAVMLVAVMFIMFRKKKQRKNNTSGSEGGNGGGIMSSLGFVSKKRMPDLSGSGGVMGFWKPKDAGAERLGDSVEEKPMSRYMVRDGKSVPRPGSEPHRPMTGLFRSKE